MTFIDQMLEIFVSKGWYGFLDGYLRYNEILISHRIKKRPLSVAHMGYLLLKACRLGYVIHKLPSMLYDVDIFLYGVGNY